MLMSKRSWQRQGADRSVYMALAPIARNRSQDHLHWSWAMAAFRRLRFAKRSSSWPWRSQNVASRTDANDSDTVSSVAAATLTAGIIVTGGATIYFAVRSREFCKFLAGAFFV